MQGPLHLTGSFIAVFVIQSRVIDVHCPSNMHLHLYPPFFRKNQASRGQLEYAQATYARISVISAGFAGTTVLRVAGARHCCLVTVCGTGRCCAACLTRSLLADEAMTCVIAGIKTSFRQSSIPSCPSGCNILNAKLKTSSSGELHSTRKPHELSKNNKEANLEDPIKDGTVALGADPMGATCHTGSGCGMKHKQHLSAVFKALLCNMQKKLGVKSR